MHRVHAFRAVAYLFRSSSRREIRSSIGPCRGNATRSQPFHVLFSIFFSCKNNTPRFSALIVMVTRDIDANQFTKRTVWCCPKLAPRSNSYRMICESVEIIQEQEVNQTSSGGKRTRPKTKRNVRAVCTNSIPTTAENPLAGRSGPRCRQMLAAEDDAVRWLKERTATYYLFQLIDYII
jgi:hypothetical protein